jgi:2'-5' RNA ligase
MAKTDFITTASRRIPRLKAGELQSRFNRDSKAGIRSRRQHKKAIGLSKETPSICAGGGFVRTFVAIELPEEVKEEPGELQARLKSFTPFVNWVEPGQIHLTLSFLGDVLEDKLKEVFTAVEEGISKVKPFILKPSGLGCSPNFRKPRVLWVGLEGEVEILAQLQGQIEKNLLTAGFNSPAARRTPDLYRGETSSRFNRDSTARFQTVPGTAPNEVSPNLRAGGDFNPRVREKFTPHLTLGRVHRKARKKERVRLGQKLQTIMFKPFKEIIKVNKVSVIKSELFPTGPVYTRLKEFKLVG